MSAVDVKPVPVDAVQFEADDGMEHVVCCRDAIGLVALCGADVSDDPFVAEDTFDDDDLCVVCADLEQAGSCPLFGTSCPPSTPSP